MHNFRNSAAQKSCLSSVLSGLLASVQGPEGKSAAGAGLLATCCVLLMSPGHTRAPGHRRRLLLLGGGAPAIQSHALQGQLQGQHRRAGSKVKRAEGMAFVCEKLAASVKLSEAGLCRRSEVQARPSRACCIVGSGASASASTSSSSPSLLLTRCTWSETVRVLLAESGVQRRAAALGDA